MTNSRVALASIVTMAERMLRAPFGIEAACTELADRIDTLRAAGPSSALGYGGGHSNPTADAGERHRARTVAGWEQTLAEAHRLLASVARRHGASTVAVDTTRLRRLNLLVDLAGLLDSVVDRDDEPVLSRAERKVAEVDLGVATVLRRAEPEIAQPKLVYCRAHEKVTDSRGQPLQVPVDPGHRGTRLCGWCLRFWRDHERQAPTPEIIEALEHRSDIALRRAVAEFERAKPRRRRARRKAS